MPRPDDLTEAQLSNWGEQFEKTLEADARGPLPLKKSVKYLTEAREVFIAGQWLDLQLQKLEELSADERHNLTMAYGQIAFGREPWAVCRIVLRDAIIGRMYRPGPSLAEALVQGQLDKIFGVGPDFTSAEGMRRWLDATGFSSVKELLASSGASSVGELKDALQAEIARMEATIR